jgi:integrase
MSVYSVKKKGWRFDFTLNGQRYTEAWFPTKREASTAEAARKEELRNPVTMAEPELTVEQEETSTDMAFLDLVNLRLDHVKAYKSTSYYQTYIYAARRWVKIWRKLACSEITRQLVEALIIKRAKVSPFTANKELRYLRAMFNWAKKKGLIDHNPTDGAEFLPMEKRVKYVPPVEDVEKAIAAADPDTRDYLNTIRDTMGRMGEINLLKWDDVDLKNRIVVLYTRKKRGGHLTPRRVPMTQCLFEIMSRRFKSRDNHIPWVFSHRYWSRKENRFVAGPFQDRKRLMKVLCGKAGVRYFRYHALRHAGASILDSQNVPIGTIQRILGHENRTTTERYLHSIGNSEREAMEVFERVARKSHTDSHMQIERA